MIVFGQTIIDDPLLSPEGRDLITQLLNRNTKKRLGCTLGADEIKKHKFFAGINWNNVYKRKLKPPIVPDQEFLLTSRAEPLQLPSTTGGSSSEETQVQSDYDFFQGFSFVGDRSTPGDKIIPQSLQKLIYNDNIRPGEKTKTKSKTKHPKGSKVKRSKSSLPRKKKKRSIASTIPGLDMSGVGTHIDGVQTHRPDAQQLKLDLLREQASRDNRNRKFISVGEDTRANVTAQKTISTEGTAILREQKKLQRSQSFTDHDLNEFGTPKAQKRKKKKHLSSNIAHMLLSPRRKSQQPQQPINQNCDKCEVLLDTFNSYLCKSCHSVVCKNCLWGVVSIPKDKSEEIIQQRNCVTCYYMQCIKVLRTQK